MTLKEVLQPAVQFATEGFGVSEVIAHSWQSNEAKLAARPSGKQMLPGGRAPRYGEVAKLPELGKTLQMIGEGGPDAFYRGKVAEAIAKFVQQEGGWLAAQDLAEHHSDWDQPISTNYRGVTVYECPPAGQGIAALIALNIAEGFDIAGMGFQTPDTYHHLIESMRLGYADALQYVADPRVVEVPIGPLLSKKYATRRRGLIRRHAAMPEVSYGDPMGASDTVYVTAVDGDGNACSLINSLYQGFGSGLVVPGYGIALQNRGALFSLDTRHPNYLQGRKRPFHTIIPAMATRRRGHKIKLVSGYERTGFGGGQVIARDPETGVLTAGSEPRKDGAAAGW
jgi:gamma-glutamyltranspeptidase/glutathione hydrolase